MIDLTGKKSLTDRFYNSEPILTFKELVDVLNYDWGFDPNNLVKLDENTYQVNKTTIGKDFVDYKTEHSYLAPGVFEKLEKFYELLEEK